MIQYFDSFQTAVFTTEIWVNLFVTMNGEKLEPQWADGTFFADTELGQEMAQLTLINDLQERPMRLKQSFNGSFVFDDISDIKIFNIVCQRRIIGDNKLNEKLSNI